MLRTSIVAVVLGCFYFCPLDCDIPVVDCAAVEAGCMLEKYVTSPLLLLSFASILLVLLLLRRDMHFCFFVEVLLLLIIFLVGCAAAADGACAAYNISTEAERGTGYCFFFYVSVVYTAMLRTSTAAVVLGCFYFCPLDCDIPVMVVDCAAFETGCMLEKYRMVAHLQCYNKKGYIRTWYVYKISSSFSV